MVFWGNLKLPLSGKRLEIDGIILPGIYGNPDVRLTACIRLCDGLEMCGAGLVF